MFELSDFTVFDFFIVTVIIRDGVQFFPGLILRNVTIIKMVPKLVNNMIVGLVLQMVALAKGQGWI